VSFFIYGSKANQMHENQRRKSLKTVFEALPGYQTVNDIPLDNNIIEALKLDDYLYRGYAVAGNYLTLYIGFYNSSQKVGAAHDPLVCFPGQGWVLSGNTEARVKVSNSSSTAFDIHYNTMVAKRPGQTELIAYWFQAYDKTVTNTLSQKMWTALEQLKNRNSANAFVRVSMQISEGADARNEKAVIEKFIQQFYPLLIDFIRNGRVLS
jgi:EpsI family protein